MLKNMKDSVRSNIVSVFLSLVRRTGPLAKSQWRKGAGLPFEIMAYSFRLSVKYILFSLTSISEVFLISPRLVWAADY